MEKSENIAPQSLESKFIRDYLLMHWKDDRRLVFGDADIQLPFNAADYDLVESMICVAAELYSAIVKYDKQMAVNRELEYEVD